jgi:hypothetical protein
VSLDGNKAGNGEHNWGEVNLDGVEVTDVANIEIAEHADGGIGEHNHGKAQVIFLPHDNASKREEELDKDDYDSCKGLNNLLLFIELVVFPSSIKEFLSHFAIFDGFWQSVVIFLLAIAFKGGIGLLLLLFELNSILNENLFED